MSVELISHLDVKNYRFTPRLTEVFQRFISGETCNQIAAALNSRPRTVKNQLYGSGQACASQRGIIGLMSEVLGDRETAKQVLRSTHFRNRRANKFSRSATHS